jgi:AcrR family transcriptional regulator
MHELPVLGGWRPQREAAARNEAKILEAARSLLRSREAGAVEMRDIAAAAGVGIGTLYRRFGDKGRLLAAIVGEEERGLQEALLSGPPPLGRGADAPARLIAFLDALVELTERNLGVLLATDSTPPGRIQIGAYQAWRAHAAQLISDARPELSPEDAGWYADLLLAALDPALFANQRRLRGLPVESIKRNLRELVARVLG